jgi:hypothetical protein
MLAQIGTALVFDAFYVSGGVGKAGITVTVDVYNHANTRIVTAAAATEIGGGLYTYTLVAGSNTGAGNYRAIFKTADASVQQREIASVWIVGQAWVTRIDANITTRSSHTAADTWAVGTRTLTSFGTLAADVWAAGTRTLTSFGTLPDDVWAATNRTLTSLGTLAADVWNAGNRTLTSFGTLAADVWAVPTRTLTSLGTLATDVWTAGNRTLTSFGTLPADVWAVGNRTLTSFGTLVNDIWNSVRDSPGVTTLLSRLTSQRASNLDNLDASISSVNVSISSVKAKTDKIKEIT